MNFPWRNQRANPIQLTTDIPLLSQFKVYVLVGEIRPALAFLSVVSSSTICPNSLFGKLRCAAELSYQEMHAHKTDDDEFTQPDRYTAVSKLFTYALLTTASKATFEISELPHIFTQSCWTIYLDDEQDKVRAGGIHRKWLGRDLERDEIVILNVRPDGYVGSLRNWTLQEGQKASKWLEDYYGGFLSA